MVRVELEVEEVRNLGVIAPVERERRARDQGKVPLEDPRWTMKSWSLKVKPWEESQGRRGLRMVCQLCRGMEVDRRDSTPIHILTNILNLMPINTNLTLLRGTDLARHLLLDVLTRKVEQDTPQVRSEG